MLNRASPTLAIGAPWTVNVSRVGVLMETAIGVSVKLGATPELTPIGGLETDMGGVVSVWAVNVSGPGVLNVNGMLPVPPEKIVSAGTDANRSELLKWITAVLGDGFPN